MEIGDKAEEILETLWIATEEEGKPSVSLDGLEVGGDDPSLQNLIELGFISLENGEVRLGEAGRKEAEDTVRRHRLAERLLVDVLDVRGELIDESACKFEHLLHKGIDDKICTLLGHPRICPHGKPIPLGRCCVEARESGEKLVSPLTGLRPGQTGKIAYLHAGDSKSIQKFIAMGILPGTPIALIRRFPSYIFQVGYSQFAVDEEMARNIYVRLEEIEAESAPVVRGRWGFPRVHRHRHRSGK
ncbi:MAG: metal-dependent transcriptional regulator [bacterium]